ncbi:PAS domain-containing protein [Bacillus shivajii]|uniref:STAS domain-containing protein n=1 Tax=Bacillus shivajii TaxID=1983719 RepID=UPI001CF99A5F|nr:STAS domain-containing protein [Bacillus shivajii]UCZ52034.1 PAS domain-containing protein [Bacillus shivajii]
MNTWDRLHPDTYAVLNSLSDNVFLADLNLNLQWMNDAAKSLIFKFVHHLNIEDPNELIGTSLRDVHPEKSKFSHVMKSGKLPHSAHIHIFDGYVGDILVNEARNYQGEKVGYLLFWRDVTKENEKREKDRQLIEEISTPVLPTILENTLLVPLIGTYDVRRIEMLKEKVLWEAADNDTDHLIFDMTSLTAIDDYTIIDQFYNINETVAVTGVETYFVGFSSELVKKFIQHGIKMTNKSFPKYNQALIHIMDKEGLEIAKKAE